MTENQDLTISDNFTETSDVVIYHGMAIDFVKSIPEKSIDLIVASPPYNTGKEYEENVSISEYVREQEEIIPLMCKIMKETGSICWQVGNYVSHGEVFPLDIFYYKMFKDQGMYLRNRIVWRFGHGLHTTNRFSGRYETILWFSKSDEYIFNLDPVRVPAKYPGKKHSKGPQRGQISGNPKGKNPSDYWEIEKRNWISEWEDGIWEIPNVKAHHIEKTIHPCQFPVELVERCVLALTDENGRVLDPYMGVGSTLLAAILHNRKALGSEKEMQYVEIAKERIVQLARGELRTRPLGKPIYEPSTENVAKIPDEWIKDASSIYYQDKE
ncbi:DNA modification methylase [Longilinea arvoryzae]|uniref:Methyltransferase n=1 Tax=Longilinea arvoryzae TaxID=360412 RepID=A0A0S7BGE6_9CHLR|nr:site-specific DNA-methyltransferase [Longilinea arvoryzae]GAP12789.1 DNA modification methylase [Longilinea arvoryzae]